MMTQCALKLARQREFVIRGIALGLTLMMAAGWTGCGKKETPAASAPVTQAAPPPQQPAATPPPAAAAASPMVQNGQPDLAEMNRTLIRWIVRNRRPPANFQDFAATAGVEIPPPPAGKKYVIAQNMHIQLVNQ